MALLRSDWRAIAEGFLLAGEPLGRDYDIFEELRVGFQRDVEPGTSLDRDFNGTITQ